MAGLRPEGVLRLGPPVRCRDAHGCCVSLACDSCPVGTGAVDICQTWALTGRWRSPGRCQAALNWHLDLPFCENISSSHCFFTPSFLFYLLYNVGVTHNYFTK